MPTPRREELKASFVAKDPTGRDWRLNHYQTLIETTNRDDLPRRTWAPVPGSDTVRTANGQPVERVERGVYLTATGVELRSTAPNAL